MKIPPGDMRYWQNRQWLLNSDIPPEMIALGKKLADEEERLFEQIHADDLNEAICDAFAENLRDSFWIENENLNSSAIKSSLIRQMNMDLPGWRKDIESERESRAVSMTLYMLRYGDLTHGDICKAHGFLSDNPFWGKYRINDEVIKSGEEVIYYAPEPYLVNGQMDDFLDWHNGDRKNLPSAIGAAISHYIFVVIHPFGDGNGRIARAIAERAMITDGNHRFRPYCLSKFIAENQRGYYKALESPDPLDFPNFMLNMHSKALEDGFDKARRLQFLRYFLKRGNFSPNEAAMIKEMALNEKIAWRPNDFKDIENAKDAYDNLKTKGVIDGAGVFRKEWRPVAQSKLKFLSL